jgi:hypothetical protein
MVHSRYAFARESEKENSIKNKSNEGGNKLTMISIVFNNIAHNRKKKWYEKYDSGWIIYEDGKRPRKARPGEVPESTIAKEGGLTPANGLGPVRPTKDSTLRPSSRRSRRKQLERR